MDEPTSGLDPNQLVEIRSLIKQLGQEKTVIFSTHVMQEVQALCDRVVIIDKGKIVADDSIERLQQRVRGEEIIIVEFVENVSSNKLKSIQSVKRVEKVGMNRWKVFVDSNNDVRAGIFSFAVTNNLTLLELHKEISSVEDVFQILTKK